MKIVCSKLFEEQLQDTLELIANHDINAAKNFKTYLETIIINIASKVQKYKKSIYFDNENIKDIEFQGCVVIFLVDSASDAYVLLGLTRKS